ncbi:major facilitator family transport protein [Salmonella enterica subsp. enterica]|uniref:Major facilitator family transport protein n=1 Tax=Salmonella enterica I TaxID=59201 RepID=A0A379WYL4_SALET|nr:major facilitator family transport protein [Salmonella enterica subsp. enterica]
MLGYVYGSTSTDHIRYGATGRQRSINRHCDRHLRAGGRLSFKFPLGCWSDRIGRKPLIVGGLAVFVAGSVIAALSHSIWGIILGRALQGSGAIAAAVMALLSDLTREQNRTKAMAFIGVSFGITFAIAMVLGPIVTHSLGLNALFWMIAAPRHPGHYFDDLGGSQQYQPCAESRIRDGQRQLQ